MSDDLETYDLKGLVTLRKSLNIINSMFIIFLLGKPRIGEITLLGTKLDFEDPAVLIYFLIAVWLYYNIKHFQVFSKVGWSLFYSALINFGSKHTTGYLKRLFLKTIAPEHRSSINIISIKVDSHRFHSIPNIFSPYDNLSFNEILYNYGQAWQTEYGDIENRKESIHISKVRFIFLRINCTLRFTFINPEVFDNFLPFLLSLLVLFLIYSQRVYVLAALSMSN